MPEDLDTPELLTMDPSQQFGHKVFCYLCTSGTYKTKCSRYVRGVRVIRSKCAGPHNLKTVYLRRQLFQVIFWCGHHQYGCFLQRFIYHRTVAASSPVAIVGATPYTLFLKVPWSTSSFPALILLPGQVKRLLVRNTAKSVLDFENSGDDGNLSDGLAKDLVGRFNY
jgi:hypothetical protein